MYLVQSKFNNRRGGELQRDRQAAERQAAERGIAVNQANLDAPELQRFDTPGQLALEPEPALQPSARPVSPRASSSRQRGAVYTGVSADDLALAQASFQPPHIPLLVYPPTPTADALPANPAPSETPKHRPRPKMRPPPVDNSGPVPDTMLAQSPPRRRTETSTGIPHAGLPLPQPKLPCRALAEPLDLDTAAVDPPVKASSLTKAKRTGAKAKAQVPTVLPPSPPHVPALTGWPDPPVTPHPSPITEVTMRPAQRSPSPQHPLSGTGAPPAPRVLVQETPESQAPTNHLMVDKSSTLVSRTGREPALKKSRAQGAASKAPQAEIAVTTTTDPLTDTPVPLIPGASDRRYGLRSGKAAAAAAAAEQTAAARQKEQSKKRVAPPLKGSPSKKGKGKTQDAPHSSPPSEPLQPESEDPSENDDGFHSLEED
ncbi:hypothetical protein BDV93DRAFT_591701 [Ceratobasidium sp. AG-I]|nr:hypothetical protein BDV93DRAFT_591701 [Ceratobasidium sp. AG-I]